jgi:hypothetical protein
VIRVELTFDEAAVARLLEWLADVNHRLMLASPSMPLLYDSGVVYQRELRERFSDYAHVLLRGHDDCDSLAAARVGELRARGWRALRPGEGGYEIAQVTRPKTIPARIVIRTRRPKDDPGQYHVLLNYQLGGTTFYDDPSARLGMYSRRLGAEETQRHLAEFHKS